MLLTEVHYGGIKVESSFTAGMRAIESVHSDRDQQISTCCQKLAKGHEHTRSKGINCRPFILEAVFEKLSNFME